MILKCLMTDMVGEPSKAYAPVGGASRRFNRINAVDTGGDIP
jgi:hypothetical protein